MAVSSTGGGSSARTVVTRRFFVAGGLTIIGAGGAVPINIRRLKCYYNYSFWVKMSALAIGLLYTFLIKHPVIRRGAVPTVRAGLGILSLGVWLTVAGAGRWIGFS